MWRKVQEGRVREQLREWRRSVGAVKILSSYLSFFKILSRAPHTPGISEAPFLSLFRNSSFCFLQQNWLQNVIISCCLCALTYASRPGPVFGQHRLTYFPPPPYNVGPCKKFSQEVFKCSFRIGFLFQASRFYDNAVYAGSALFSSFWIFFYSNNSCNMYHFNYPGGLHSAYNELSCASNFCPLYSDKEAQRQGRVTGEQRVRQGSKRKELIKQLLIALPLCRVQLCLAILKFKMQSGAGRPCFRRGFC